MADGRLFAISVCADALFEKEMHGIDIPLAQSAIDAKVEEAVESAKRAAGMDRAGYSVSVAREFSGYPLASPVCGVSTYSERSALKRLAVYDGLPPDAARIVTSLYRSMDAGERRKAAKLLAAGKTREYLDFKEGRPRTRLMADDGNCFVAFHTKFVAVVELPPEESYEEARGRLNAFFRSLADVFGRDGVKREEIG